MIPEIILTALFLGWVLRGRFGRLADVKLQFIWMIYVPLGLYFAAFVANYADVFSPQSFVFGMVHVIGLAALMVVAVANRHVPGAKLMFVGLAANTVAIVANGGFMPASKEAIVTAFGAAELDKILAQSMFRHAFIDAGTRLRWLCDVVAAPRPFVLVPSVYSVGDILTSVGGLIAIVAIMRTPLPGERPAPQRA